MPDHPRTSWTLWVCPACGDARIENRGGDPEMVPGCDRCRRPMAHRGRAVEARLLHAERAVARRGRQALGAARRRAREAEAERDELRESAKLSAAAAYRSKRNYERAQAGKLAAERRLHRQRERLREAVRAVIADDFEMSGWAPDEVEPLVGKILDKLATLTGPEADSSADPDAATRVGCGGSGRIECGPDADGTYPAKALPAGFQTIKCPGCKGCTEQEAGGDGKVTGFNAARDREAAAELRSNGHGPTRTYVPAELERDSRLDVLSATLARGDGSGVGASGSRLKAVGPGAASTSAPEEEEPLRRCLHCGTALTEIPVAGFDNGTRVRPHDCAHSLCSCHADPDA